MAYSLYDSWSIEEAGDIGARFRAVCRGDHGYRNHLTQGRQYEIEIIPRILPMSPLCRGIGDKGQEFECHLTRFEKIEELQDV